MTGSLSTVVAAAAACCALVQHCQASRHPARYHLCELGSFSQQTDRSIQVSSDQLPNVIT